MAHARLVVKAAKKQAQKLREKALDLEQEIDIKEALKNLTEEGKTLFEERVGIMEVDGGLSKEEAEKKALKAILRDSK